MDQDYKGGDVAPSSSRGCTPPRPSTPSKSSTEASDELFPETRARSPSCGEIRELSTTEYTALLQPNHLRRRTRWTSVMEKVRDSKAARWADRLRVNAEPGLTNAQLMLTNDDLKPVEPARRQWRSRNFVAFWIADSFNINTWMIASASIVDGLSWWQAWLCEYNVFSTLARSV